MLAAGLVALSGTTFAANITGGGVWTQTISSANLSSGPGSALVSVYESGNGVITLGISGTPTTLFYRVYVRHTGANWPGGVSVAVRRTSEGLGLLPLSVILGGTSYVTIGTVDTELFAGLLDRSGIQLQVRVSGISLAMPPGAYQANLHFTVVP